MMTKMWRRSWTVGVAATGLMVAAALSAQECPSGRQAAPHLGIRIFHCQGGSCLVADAISTIRTELPAEMTELRSRRRGSYAFSVEPSVWGIDPEGPAGDAVEEGDALVAVNGAPITTSAGGTALTEMEPGTPLELTLRRGGRLVTARVVPEASCAGVMASAGPGPRPADQAFRAIRTNSRPPVSAPEVPEGAGLTRLEAAGLVLVGEKEVVVQEDGTVRWWFVDVPVVAEVLPESPAAQAGIRAGEVLVQAGSAWLDTPEGVAALLAGGPGRPVTVIVRVGTTARGTQLYRD